MELYYVLSIVDRDRADTLISLQQKLNLSLMFANLGEGTAREEHLSLHNLEPSEKAIVSTFATASSLKALFKAAKWHLYIDIPGNGIMMAIPIKSVGGRKNLSYILNGKNVGGGNPSMNFEYELIVVILNEGFSDEVMDAARGAGATGGTMIHARGMGKGESEKFLGVSLAEEKDILYILSSSKKKTDIIKAITQECGTDTPCGAIPFSLPVSEVTGLRRIDD